MKAIFCHDLPLYKDINGVYCSTTLTNEMFSRFFVVAEHLIVTTRVYELDKTFVQAHQTELKLDRIFVEPAPNMMSAKGMLLQRGDYKKKLRNIIQNVDLVFLRGGEPANVAYEICMELNKPYLVECGGCAWESFWGHSFIGKLVAPRMEFIEKKCVKNASAVAYVTECFLQKRYPTDGISTYASNVQLDKLNEDVLKTRIEKIGNYNKKQSYVLGTTAGIDVRFKGQEYVIQAISKLIAKGYDLRYELVGKGSSNYLYNIAKKYEVEDRVCFLGEKNHEEVLKWLETIDIYAQPSKQEGLPRALIEAMSRGCPAIGSTTAGIPELLQTDVLFKADDVDAICKILIRILGNKDIDMSNLARSNFEKAKEYEYKKIERRRTELFKKYADIVLTSEKGVL